MRCALRDAARHRAACIAVVLDAPVGRGDTRQSELYSLFMMAVHGFRMPLFFLVSGFFTAMLWRRRGLAALLKQRAMRIVLPCFVGLVTIIPLLNWVSAWAIANAVPVVAPDDGSIAGAVRKGDSTALGDACGRGSTSIRSTPVSGRLR